MEPGTILVDRYRVENLLGEGGMGSVFEARHIQLGRRLAVKTLKKELCKDEGAVARFMREAQTAAAIESEHIVAVTDVGQTDQGVPFIVMEFLQGLTLADALRQQGRFAPERTAYLVIQVCRALAAAHDKGVIHRDMKPENVVLVAREDGSELAKVLDFGIAKVHDQFGDQSSDTPKLTATGTTLGTPYYMAPEQARAEKDIDQRVDIYSTGAMMYELLAGVPPFVGDSFAAIVIAAATRDPTPLDVHRPDLDPQLAAVVHRAMARDKQDRIPTARDLAEALEPFTGMALSSSMPAFRIGSQSGAAVAPTAAQTGVGQTASPVVVNTNETTVTKSKQGVIVAALAAIAIVLVSAISAVAWMLTRPPEDRVVARRNNAATQPAATTPKAEEPTVPQMDATADGAALAATAVDGGEPSMPPPDAAIVHADAEPEEEAPTPARPRSRARASSPAPSEAPAETATKTATKAARPTEPWAAPSPWIQSGGSKTKKRGGLLGLPSNLGDKQPVKQKASATRAAVKQARAHFAARRYQDCIRSLRGVEHNQLTASLRIRCYEGANQHQKACNLARHCSGFRWCHVWQQRNCQ
jgi:serine/threonine-protein kinase